VAIDTALAGEIAGAVFSLSILNYQLPFLARFLVRQDCVDSEMDHKEQPVSQGGMACESESGEGMPVCLSLCWPMAGSCNYFSSLARRTG